MPLISIIIPTHNSANTIHLALDSICCQTFTEYEVLVIDNTSTDETLERVMHYASRNSKITVHTEKDNGVYDAMNKGIDLAKGKWLYFLGDDDDFYDHLVLEDVSSILNKETDDIVYGDAITKSNNQRYGGRFDLVRMHTKGNLCHQTVFYRKSVFDTIGKYNLHYPVAADWDLNIRCFRHPGIKKLHIDRVIVRYNNKDGISSVAHYDPLYEELPILYLNQLTNSKAYKAGTFLHNLFSKMRMTRVIRKPPH